jgi:hypothetical protein
VTSAELLLHPVRLRIVQAFLGDRALTTAQLRAELSDVPAASVYRQVARLVEAGVLSVVAERRVRGAVERTYVMRAAAARISAGELAKMSPDEHRQAFRLHRRAHRRRRALSRPSRRRPAARRCQLAHGGLAD